MAISYTISEDVAHGVLPKNNREWWKEKLERNVARDREKDQQLDMMGWTVMHVWEHEDPVAAADAIEQPWRSRRLPTTRKAGMPGRHV